MRCGSCGCNNDDDATDCMACDASLDSEEFRLPDTRSLRLDLYTAHDNTGQRIADGCKFLGVTSEF